MSLASRRWSAAAGLFVLAALALVVWLQRYSPAEVIYSVDGPREVSGLQPVEVGRLPSRGRDPKVSVADDGIASHADAKDHDGGSGCDDDDGDDDDSLAVLQSPKANKDRLSSSGNSTTEALSRKQRRELRRLGYLLTPTNVTGLRVLQRDLLRRVEATQLNPAPTRFLFCHISSGCGFGCRMHRLVACLGRSVELGRVLLVPGVDTAPYNTAGTNGSCPDWDCFFQPRLSPAGRAMEASAARHTTSIRPAGPKTEEDDIVSIELSQKDDFARTVPAYMSSVKHHFGNSERQALLWYIGQLLGWLLRPSARMEKVFAAKLRELHLTLPVDVGVHIRMTDKLRTEAKLHTWREYFEHVDHRLFPGRNYHSFAELGEPTTTAFVATDEPAIFSEQGRESIASWRHNKIVWNKEGARLAGELQMRYSRDSLENLLCELYILATAKYFVGTFSSQISRLVIELKMFRGEFDVLAHADSLDENWYGAT